MPYFMENAVTERNDTPSVKSSEEVPSWSIHRSVLGKLNADVSKTI